MVERFYHEPFRVLDEAEDFLKRMKRHDERSKVSIQAYNLSEISLTGWFRTNMEVIRLSSGDAENGYAVFVDSHLANLQKILK